MMQQNAFVVFDAAVWNCTLKEKATDFFQRTEPMHPWTHAGCPKMDLQNLYVINVVKQ